MELDYLYHRHLVTGERCTISGETYKISTNNKECHMPKECNFPYPTFYESIRYIARMLDLKQSNKFLDDRAYDRIFEPRELRESLQKYIYQPISKYLGSDASRIISSGLNDSLKSYALLVASQSADGISRSDMMPLLQKCFIKDQIAKIITDIHNYFDGPSPVTLFSKDVLSVSTTLSWIEQNETGWSQHISTLKKEQRDRISAWMRGDDIPSSQSIYLLQNNSTGPLPETINWQRVRTLLFIARSIDCLRRVPQLNDLIDEIRLSLQGAKGSFSLGDEIQRLQRKRQQNIAEILPSITELQRGLNRTATKNDADALRQHISFVRKGLAGKEEEHTTGYWIDWHEARWQVFSGNLEDANKLYKTAFEAALFRSGKNQKAIIDEAIVVAASLKKPDNIFLKHLKWSLINFYYDIPSVNTSSPSKKTSDSVEDWEVDLWKSNFYTIFPENGWFPSVSYYDLEIKKGPLIVTNSTQIKPDFRYPDRKIKVGDTWKKPMPQLIWYLIIENFEVAEKLIEKGASVNVSSDVGDTPILVALQSMNVTDVPSKSLDERFFWLISKQEHTPETINRRTQKKRLLPIISAVETGRPDIVKKVLELGANPNGRGLTDEQTALNVCISRIGMLKNPDKFLENPDSMLSTPEALDSIRRHSAGLSGFTLDHQKEFLINSSKDESSSEIMLQIKNHMTESILKHMSLDSMRNIAKLLIESGADSNAEHTSPIIGYTPMMLAAELDEVELFDLMRIKGGDPEKFYINPRTGEKINCWRISDYFGSKITRNTDQT